MPWQKQFDVDEALREAMEAFWAGGYEATSTQTLLARMGINRGSLYHTFGSKRALFLAALRRYGASYLDSRIADAARAPSAREAIKGLFESVIADAAGKHGREGCLLVNSALELGARDAEIGRLVDEQFGKLEGFLRASIEAGQATGEVAVAIDAAEVARGLLALLLGMRVLARSGTNHELLGSVAARAVAMLG